MGFFFMIDEDGINNYGVINAQFYTIYLLFFVCSTKFYAKKI